MTTAAPSDDARRLGNYLHELAALHAGTVGTRPAAAIDLGKARAAIGWFQTLSADLMLARSAADDLRQQLDVLRTDPANKKE